MHDDLYTPRYFTGDGIKVSGVDATTFKSWLFRKAVIPGNADIPARGPGQPGIYTRSTLYKLAMMGELFRLGIGAARAFAAADHSFLALDLNADKPHVIVIYEPLEGQSEAETPPDDEKRTALHEATHFRIVPVEGTAEEFAEKLFSGKNVAAVVNYRPIFERVDKQLGQT